MFTRLIDPNSTINQHPGDAIPLQGTWYGYASDHEAMRVAVKGQDNE